MNGAFAMSSKEIVDKEKEKRDKEIRRVRSSSSYPYSHPDVRGNPRCVRQWNLGAILSVAKAEGFSTVFQAFGSRFHSNSASAFQYIVQVTVFIV